MEMYHTVNIRRQTPQTFGRYQQDLGNISSVTETESPSVHVSVMAATWGKRGRGSTTFDCEDTDQTIGDLGHEMLRV